MKGLVSIGIGVAIGLELSSHDFSIYDGSSIDSDMVSHAIEAENEEEGTMKSTKSPQVNGEVLIYTYIVNGRFPRIIGAPLVPPLRVAAC